VPFADLWGLISFGLLFSGKVWQIRARNFPRLMPPSREFAASSAQLHSIDLSLDFEELIEKQCDTLLSFDDDVLFLLFEPGEIFEGRFARVSLLSFHKHRRCFCSRAAWRRRRGRRSCCGPGLRDRENFRCRPSAMRKERQHLLWSAWMMRGTLTRHAILGENHGSSASTAAQRTITVRTSSPANIRTPRFRRLGHSKDTRTLDPPRTTFAAEELFTV
jgi:hypothetical protein